jgi:hypothetical protein
MKDFFKECLANLKDIANINQLHWIMQECNSQEEFDKRKNILIDSMMIVSKKFDYIPEGIQQKYILKMMVEDQVYDGLSSRVIWKWLDMHKTNHMTHSQFDEASLMQHEPASDEQVRKYVAEFMANMEKIGNPEYKNGIAQLRKESGIESVKATVHSNYKPLGESEVINKLLHIEWIRECFDPLTGKPNANWISEDEFLRLQ